MRGTWKLSAFLEQAGGDNRHSKYRARGSPVIFFDNSSDHPVLLGEVPPESDPALGALDRL